jgi:hypothetical protein
VGRLWGERREMTRDAVRHAPPKPGSCPIVGPSDRCHSEPANFLVTSRERYRAGSAHVRYPVS